jgi:hypothetical protein
VSVDPGCICDYKYLLHYALSQKATAGRESAKMGLGKQKLCSMYLVMFKLHVVWGWYGVQLDL